MSRITVYANSTISIDGKTTGYRVRQTSTGTVVERHATYGSVLPLDLGDTVAMPSPRYALSCRECVPLSGVPNANNFDMDLLKIWDTAQRRRAVDKAIRLNYFDVIAAFDRRWASRRTT